MPKVETFNNSLLRGDNSSISFPNYVSKCIGNNCNTNSINKIRFKRDLTNINMEDTPKRRIVKKLIRIEPIYTQNINMSHKNYYNPNDYLKLNINHNKYVDKSNEYVGEPSTPTNNKLRKRIIIKKKLKNQLDLDAKEYLGETTNNRRRVIVTKKRILNPSTLDSRENFINNNEVIIKPTRRVRIKKIKHTINPLSETFYENVVSTPESVTENNIEEETTNENEVTSRFDGITDENFNDVTELTTNSLHLNSDEEEDEASTEEYDDDDYDDVTTDSRNKNLPDYEPFFPELSESLDAPILLLKTTVLSSIEFQTKTVVQSKLRTYTFVVTRVNGAEQIVTSTTEVKPHTKTITVTEPMTRYTTLTLLDLDATETLPFIPMTVYPSSMGSSKLSDIDEETKGKALDEARYNLATRVMSNGVEVIVAGDKSTLPGEPDIKRVLPSTIYKPITLKPSTLTNNMMMMLPQDASNIESLSSSLYPNQFVTKTCLTTFTYLTTYLENGTTAVSSHEQVVSNIATEERNTGKILPTPTMGITLTQYPNLAVGTFVTTYTYLNTILDGEQPLVVTSKRLVSNTVTAPDDYLSLFQPDDKALAVKDTNTYYSTIALEKTLFEGKISKVIKTNEVVTQVVITESVPPKGTSVMTSYIALDFEDQAQQQTQEYSTTDVLKTYFVTYTYYNTLVDGDKTVINTNISTSRDVVTEKLFLHPKKNKNPSKSVINTSPILKDNKKKNKVDIDIANFNIVATKTYLTTFTYFTTLLQEDKETTSTILSSHTRVVENIVTEVIEPSLLNKKYLNSLKKEIRESGSLIRKNATLNDGQKIEIAISSKEKIKPTKVLPIEKTQMPEIISTTPKIESSNPNVVTGSTIIFVDDLDDPFAIATKDTPVLTKPSKTQSKNALNSLLSSEIVKKPQSVSANKLNKSSKKTLSPAKTTINVSTTKLIDKKPANKVTKPAIASPVSNLLGSINIQALTPVLNAMAGLIQTNLKAKKNETPATTPQPKKTTLDVEPAIDIQNRSPIYIPVGGLSDIETAESEHIANVWEDEQYNEQVSKLAHESPLLHGGIPISPGEIITTNSDVIVGKPGRVGPRIPTIPLNHPDLATVHPQEIPIGMKPPPIPNKSWPKRHNDQYVAATIPIVHAPNKDDYVGPPPPPQKIPIRPQNAIRGEKYKGNEHRHIPLNVYDEAIYDNHKPVQLQDGLIVASPNLQSSLLNEPLSLPEVIERSTGQPLLVNIQPSQVAFVNIPHNRTTALIYGGSTELHINGQYFDDPSPYPEPEFSAIESFSNGVPKFASIYNGQNNQKEVGGVIKVGTHPINIQPPAIPIGMQHLHIQPTRPSSMNLINGIHVDSHVNHHDINVQVPPISFGMVHKDNEYNAHIIKHNDQQTNIKSNEHKDVNVQLHSSAIPYPFDSFHNKNYQTPHHQQPFVHIKARPKPIPIENPYQSIKDQRFDNAQHPEVIPPKNPIDNTIRSRPRPIIRPKYPKPIHQQRPDVNNQNGDLSSFMVPPPIHSPEQFLQIYNQQHSRPVTDYNNKYNQNVRPTTQSHHVQDFSIFVDDADNHKEDDIANEAGEVIQESNSRPLVPGQIPIEVLRANKTTITTKSTSTTPKSTSTRHSSYNYIPNENEILSYVPNIKQPTPFQHPIVRPENHQSNQINHKESNVIVQSGSPNVYANVFQHTQQQQNVPLFVSQTTERVNVTRHPQIINRRPEIYHTTRYPIRQRITSLPIDSNKFITSPKPYMTSANSQTEEPFKSFTKPASNIFSFGSQDILKSRRTTTTTTYRPRTTTRKSQYQLNYGEIQNINNATKKPLEMEIMRPPPPPPIKVQVIEGPIKMPDINLNPPRVETIKIATPPSTTTKQYSITEKPKSEIVMGLTPPPPVVTTHLTKPIYSMEIDPPKLIRSTTRPSTYVFEVPQATRVRRPLTRRPTNRRTTTTPPPPPTTTHATISSTLKQISYWNRPAFNYTEIHRNRTTFAVESTTHRNRVSELLNRTRPSYVDLQRNHTRTTESKDIHNTTTPINTIDYVEYNINKTIADTLNEYKEMQSKLDNATKYTIGNSDEIHSTVQTTPIITIVSENDLVNSSIDLDLQESNPPRKHDDNTSNVQLFIETLHHGSLIPTGTVETVELELPDYIAPTKHGIYNKATHNDIKIIDTTTTPRRRIVTSIFKRPIIKESKVVLPTRYITHTKTATVTITKTTVVRSLGGPPSTMTILVTKTEKSTIVDTVTEFHTLVKPTTIAETITINQTPTEVVTHTTDLIKPTQVHPSEIEPTIMFDDSSDELEDFIIKDSDAPIQEEDEVHNDNDGDSFFVVMTDKNQGSIIKIPKGKEPDLHETQHRDEIINNNELNRVLLGGILIASPPSLDTHLLSDKCTPECKPSRNEVCSKVDVAMRCVCRPGFARMFPDRPCKPTYTYTLKLGLERNGKEYLKYDNKLANDASQEYIKLAKVTHEGLDRMVMQSDLRDIYHGISVQGFEPIDGRDGVFNTFNLQLSDNTDEMRLKDVFKKYLRNNNYSLGGTELYAAKEVLDRLEADDFNECSDPQYHDCSEFSQCFNLRGTYTCSCKEGYADLSENILYPGRICSAELVGCEKCHYHGTCYSRSDEQISCECFQWYAGESCQVNLKVLLIALVTLGAILFTLLLICIVITCARRRPQTHLAPGIGFLPARLPPNRGGSTLDRRAMIQDTSSESGQSDNNTLPYVAKNKKKLKGALKKNIDLENGESSMTYAEQKDRSLTVMIPRAKYHPAPPTTSHNQSAFDKRRHSAASSNEAKLLSYLDAGPSPNRIEHRKCSRTSDQYKDIPSSRKTSGALISAGFEVSATVGINNLGTLGTIATTCGTEADRSENATLIQKISADLLSTADTHSQFNTLRKSLGGTEEEIIENWLDITPRIQTISESRSYDETTIQPPTKCLKNDYDSKSSQHHLDEANTMAERDLGSTFLLPHTHLYKPDRGSDISGFESL